MRPSSSLAMGTNRSTSESVMDTSSTGTPRRPRGESSELRASAMAVGLVVAHSTSDSAISATIRTATRIPRASPANEMPSAPTAKSAEAAGAKALATMPKASRKSAGRMPRTSSLAPMPAMHTQAATATTSAASATTFCAASKATLTASRQATLTRASSPWSAEPPGR